MPRGRKSLVVAVATLASMVALHSSQAPAAVSPVSRLLSLLNGSRSSSGASPLILDSRLSSIAQQHAQRMASQGRLFHNSSFASQAQPWNTVGENVGSGPDPDTIHRSWMGSAMHRANILNRSFNLVGIGVVSSGGRLWVVEGYVGRAGVSAAPPPHPPRAAAPRVVPPPPPPPPPPEPAEPSPMEPYLDTVLESYCHQAESTVVCVS